MFTSQVQVNELSNLTFIKFYLLSHHSKFQTSQSSQISPNTVAVWKTGQHFLSKSSVKRF